MIWLSPLLLSVPNHPGKLLINHLWKKDITARCMFSLKFFQRDPGQLGPRLSGKELLRGHLIFGLPWTSLLSQTRMKTRVEKVCRLDRLSLSVLLGICQSSTWTGDSGGRMWSETLISHWRKYEAVGRGRLWRKTVQIQIWTIQTVCEPEQDLRVSDSFSKKQERTPLYRAWACLLVSMLSCNLLPVSVCHT